MILGNTDKAANLYGKTVHLAWKVGCSAERMTDLMIKASNVLTANDMPDDAFEGLRALSMSFIRQNRLELAMRLGNHLPVLYRDHPKLFPNAPALTTYIRTTCDQLQIFV
jgi:hypothetical protein